MMLKKWISAFLAVLLLFSVCVIPITADEDNKVQYDTEISFLTKVGVLDETFRPDEVLSRAAYTAVVMKMMHPDLDFSNDDADLIFSDVPVDHAYFSYIKACKELKIVSGDRNTAFRPDDPISVIEAITMLVNALGYTPYVAAGGGYPTGYYAVAKSSGISKNVDLSAENVVGAVAAKLTYNALFADIIGIDSISGSSVYVEINRGKNLLSERMGIQEYDALVTDNGVTSLFGDSVGDMEKIVLQDNDSGNNIVAFSAGTGIDNYVGARVKVFVKSNEENGRNEVIYFEPHKNAHILTISADSIMNVQPTYIEYETDKELGKNRKLQFSSSSPLVLLNGQRFLDYESDTFRPEDGILTFSDYNNDGKYDIISIYNFHYYDGGILGNMRNIVVDKADEEEGYISCKFNPAMNLDLDPDKYGYKIINSEAATLSDISEYDIVSVAQALEPVDGKTFYFLMVSSQSEPVMVNAITATGIDTGDKVIELSGSILAIKKNYTSRLTFGSQITVCYDVTGKAAYFIMPADSGKKYGYLISAMAENGVEDVVRVKYLNREGKVLISDLRGKTTIDGVPCTTVSAQMEALQKRPDGGEFMLEKDSGGNVIGPGDTLTKPISRPIIYETNSDGLLTKIDTDTPNLPVSNEDTAYSDQTFIKYSQDEIEQDNSLKAAYRSPRVAELRNGSNSIDGKFYFSSATTFLSVADIDTYGLETYKQTAPDIQGQYSTALNYNLIKLHELEQTDENYKVLKSTDIKAVNALDIQAYDIDPDTGMAGLVVLRGRIDIPWYQNMSTSASNPMYVFLKMTEVYDETKDRLVKKIYFTKDGTNKMSAMVDMENLYFAYRYIIEGSTDNPYNIKVEPLKEGDVIRVFQTNGYLTYLERVFDCANLRDSYSAGLYPTTPRSPYALSSGGGVKVPCNFRYLYAGQTNNYVVGAWYPKAIKNGSLSAFLGYDSSTTNNGKLSHVQPGKTLTYTEQYLNIAGQQIVVVTKEPDGKIKVKEGTVSDIACYNDTKDLKNTSILLLKHTNYKLEQMLVYNGF